MNLAEDRTPTRAEMIKGLFQELDALEAQKSEITVKIAEALEVAEANTGVPTKALKMALKWYRMSEGEKNDLDQAMQLAAQALADVRQADLFEDPDDSIPGAVSMEQHRRNRRKVTDAD